MKKISAQHVLDVIEYFSVFQYPVTVDEIHTYYPVKTTKKTLNSLLIQMVESKLLIKDAYYTLPPHSIFMRKRGKRAIIARDKLKKVALFTRIVSATPIIKLIGLSGSMAMNNAENDDDVDLFIITAKNRLFTARFIALLLTQILGKRRQRGGKTIRDRLCLNLFFDEVALKIPNSKKNKYIAHEVVQMVPLIMREGVYGRFIKANRWVFNYFPNARESLEFRVKNSEFIKPILNSKLIHNSKFIILNYLGDLSEIILKYLQLSLINSHRTTELITDHQLWFFPDDYEKKLDKKFIE